MLPDALAFVKPENERPGAAGGDESNTNVREENASTLPALSVALTWIVYEPSAGKSVVANA